LRIRTGVTLWENDTERRRDRNLQLFSEGFGQGLPG
jgi:hypothetical protein